MDQIRAEIGQMRLAEEEEFMEASRRANWAVTSRNIAYLAAGSLNLAFLGWMFGKISREMRRRQDAALEISRQKELAHGTRPKVLVRAEARNGAARIWVEDNGIGIPLQAQPRLFGLFQRLTSEYEGTGLGLAIVRKVGERMGGQVGAESEPRQGSRFWVELRLIAAPKE